MLKHSKALARSKSIDQQLEEEREKRGKEIQLLILGGASSGKSTFIKQLRIQHGDGFPEPERKKMLLHVYENLVDALVILLSNMGKLGLEFSQDHNQTFGVNLHRKFPKWRRYHSAMSSQPDGNSRLADDMDKMEITSNSHQHEIRHEKQSLEDYNFVLEHLDEIKQLWRDGGIQKCFSCRDLLDPTLKHSEIYFLQNLERVLESGYIPSIQDILLIRKPTIAVQEHSFITGSLHYRVIDVAGQKNQRKKWIHFFEGVTAVLFFVAINGYCENLEEDGSLNSLEDSLVTFDDVVRNKFLERTDFILFLNKKDLFAQYLQHTPLSVSLPQYTGPNTPADCIEHIRGLFFQRKLPNKEIYCHVTCAIDRELMKSVISEIMQIIIEINLRTAATPL